MTPQADQRSGHSRLAFSSPRLVHSDDTQAEQPLTLYQCRLTPAPPAHGVKVKTRVQTTRFGSHASATEA
jgi:hypothetical protein